MNAVTIQIQIDKDTGHVDAPVFFERDLQDIVRKAKKLAEELEQYGYVRSGVYLNRKLIQGVELP